MLPRWAQAAHPSRALELARCAAGFRQPAAFARAYLRVGAPPVPHRLRDRAGWVDVELNDWHDAATAWVVFCRREYAVPRDAACIVDLGANFGAFSLYAASVAPRARVLAVEPHPEQFPRLRENVGAERLAGRVQPLRVAVAARAGERWMDADPAHPGPSRGIHPADEESPPASVRVPALTLAEILDRARAETGARRIDLVKMDIEGAEHEIVPQLRTGVLDPVDRWAMEYHPNAPRGPLFAALEAAGLRLVHDRRTHPDSGVAHFSR
jgi:FkbM family methyltransferase